MSIINLGNMIALVGVLLSSFFFSKGIGIIGVLFVPLIIVGLLMNPPKPL